MPPSTGERLAALEARYDAEKESLEKRMETLERKQEDLTKAAYKFLGGMGVVTFVASLGGALLIRLITS